jgi:predicted amidophosphoribosyltransferase
LQPAPSTSPFPAVLSYDGAGRELVARLKYRDARGVVRPLARSMAALVTASVDIVTWAPTSPARRRARGFDQAELLARGVARELVVPCRSLLRRLPGPPQTGRPRAERLTGIAFRIRPGVPARVLVVDDVVTTGTTIREAISALRGGGASQVSVVVAAATPDRHDSARGVRRSLIERPKQADTQT